MNEQVEIFGEAIQNTIRFLFQSLMTGGKTFAVKHIFWLSILLVET